MIRKAETADLAALAALACQLWPEHTVEEMLPELAETMAKPEAAFFLAYAGETPVGFAQCQLRHDYVEGTDSSPGWLLRGYLRSRCIPQKGSCQRASFCLRKLGQKQRLRGVCQRLRAR